MKEDKKKINNDFSEELWEKIWKYIKTLVGIVREPVLILDKDLRVMTANESFYRTFQTDSIDTEKKLIYELGNGEWNISSLRKLLEEILPNNNFFTGYEVIHNFPFIGQKVMILNARRIYFKDDSVLGMFSPIIFLAMEDATEMMVIAETLAGHANLLEDKFAEKTRKLEFDLIKLEKEVNQLKVGKL